MQVLKALGAAMVLTALMVGAPALLLAWGSPLALLDVQWSTVLLRPDDGTVLLGVLSLAGWVAWLFLTSATVIEVISHLSRRRWHLRLPGASWLQPVVGGLVAMALTPMLSPHAEDVPPVISSHARVTVQTDSPSGSQSPVADPRLRHHVVLPGDELWGIAERELGSGSRWREIVGCNPGMTMDTPLIPGATILLPATAAVSASGAPSNTIRITVRRGDTLWDLAGEHLGDPRRWPELFEANRDVITDADDIDVGWQLTVPQEPHPPSTASPEPTTTIRDDVTPPQPPPPPPPPLPVHTASPTVGFTITPVVHAPGTARTATAPPAAPTAPVETPPGPVDSGAADAGTSLDPLGPVGGVLAASLVAGVVARRRIQLLHREIGRRITTLAPALQRFFSALVQRSHESSDDQPGLHPTSVVVGWNQSGDMHVNVEQEGCTLLAGAQEDTAAMAATVLTSLMSADWSATVEVVAVQPHDDWGSALDDPRLTVEPQLDDAFAHLQRLCARRRLQLGHDDLTTVRADEDRAHLWAPVVFVFCKPLQPAHLDRIRDCLSLGEVGVSVVAATGSSPPTYDSATVVAIESATHARLESTGVVFQPQLLTQPARRAVMSLFVAAMDEATHPAPWWHAVDPLPLSTVTVLPKKVEEPLVDTAMTAWSATPDHPTLLLLGPVELLGARGVPPQRAVGQCMEYCAWLLLHPGSTPTAMVRELLVAEGTRRSNMSRLRSWLGDDPSGKPYLPDAYTGRIALAPAVTSDWERFQSLLAGGVNLSSTPLLHEALSLVRSRPLDGVAFQWPWVAQWLTDMLSMITDAATVLSDRCLTDGDPTGALWAIDQGLRATGDDETLTVRRIQVLAAIGDRPEVEAAITRLTRAARAENRDLGPDSIRRIQQALHAGMTTDVTLRRRPNIAIRDSGGRPVG